MDDLVISSQLPEVVWDCGSPSPNAWRSCQVPLSSGEKVKPLSSVKKGISKREKQKQSFKIHSKSLEKARAIIAQLKSMNPNSQPNTSTFDKIFDQSGGQENLPSPLNSKEAIPVDFWSDSIDVFNDCMKEKSESALLEKMSSPLQIVKPTTSTPLNRTKTKTPYGFKRKHLKRAGKKSEKFGSENILSNESADSSMPGVVPFSPCAKPSSRVELDPDTLTSDITDFSAEFLTSFHQPKDHPTPSKANCVKTVTISSITSASEDVDSNYCRSKHKLSKSPHQTLPIPSKFEKAIYKPRPCKARLVSENNVSHDLENSVGISDEILSQLVMDDSWTVSCTVNAKKPPVKLDGISFTKQPELDSILTQLVMDDSWTVSCTAEATQSPVSKSTPSKSGKSEEKELKSVLLSVKRNIVNALPTSTAKISASEHPVKSTVCLRDQIGVNHRSNGRQTSPELPPTIPVPLPNPSCDPPLCNAPRPVLPARKTTKFNFRPAIPAQLSHSSKQAMPKCTPAEIEEKRLKALQRKHLKRKS